MDGSSCGFNRVRSRLLKIIKGTKKAAYYKRMLHSPKSLARRLALSLFLPTASSYHEALAVAQLDKADAACAEAGIDRPDGGFFRAAPCLFILRPLPPPQPPISFCAGTAPKLF
jgi:hypothetical protein